MKASYLRLTLSSLFFVCASFLFSQNLVQLNQIATFNSQLNWFEFKNPQNISSTTFFNTYSNAFGLSADDNMMLINSETDEVGFSHITYQQYYKNLPVENAMFKLHGKNNHVYTANGKLARNLNISNIPSISSTVAINNAISYVNSAIYAWQDSLSEASLKLITNNSNATYYPVPELLIAHIDSSFNFTNTNFKLAYKVDIHSKQPYSAKSVYVDAQNGQIIKLSDINRSCQPTANQPTTLFSGPKTLNVSTAQNPQNGNNIEYVLQNPCKGGGITTSQQTSTTVSNVFNATNTWNSTTNFNKALYQVHWGTEQYYDFLKSTFNRNSIDNQNLPLKSIVNSASSSSENAEWNEYDNTVSFYIPSSNPINGLAFCTNDVIGHEFSHGLSKNMISVSLPSIGEPGAIGEGISDVFGVIFERFVNGNNFNWEMFDEYYALNTSVVSRVRNLSNPLLKNMPNTYNGIYYTNNQPHEAGQVLGYWFYLLSQGGSGTNSSPLPSNLYPHSYNVSAIGIAAASKIIYNSMHYITNTVSYHELRKATIQAATNLYGTNCNDEVNQVKKAWDAVGVYDLEANCGLDFCINKTIVSCNPFPTFNIEVNVSSGSGNYTYFIMDNNNNYYDQFNIGFNQASIENISGTGTYTLYVTDMNISCTKEYVFEVLPPTPITLNVNTIPKSICYGDCITINATGADKYFINGNLNLSGTLTDCPLTNTTYIVVGLGIDGCSNDSKIISVEVKQPITVTANTYSICSGQNVLITPQGATSYTLMPGNIIANTFNVSPTNTTLYTIYGKDEFNCTTSATLNVTVGPQFCCQQGNELTVNNGVFNGTGNVYHLNSSLVLSNDLTLANLTVFMGHNAEIIIPDNTKLTLNTVHFLGCPIMWRGIKSSGNKASISVQNNSLIEDAIIAVDFKNVNSPKTGDAHIINFNSSTFNKNRIALNIENYTLNNNYPSYINNTVFTCRNLITNDHINHLGFVGLNYNWNATNANQVFKNTSYNGTNVNLISNGIGVNTNHQFSAANFPVSNLNIPYQNQISRHAININNVFFDDEQNDAYKGFVIGQQGSSLSSLNLFDRQGVGINSTNSNLFVYNTAFQYMQQYFSGNTLGLSQYEGGAGIRVNTTTNNYSSNVLVVQPSIQNSYGFATNLFFNNPYAVLANNVRNLSVSNVIIHSNRAYQPTIIGQQIVSNGEYGIYASSNYYNDIKINNNFITNVNNGVVFIAAGTIKEFYHGNITVTNNYLQADYAGINSAKAMLNAITVDNLINCAECIANDRRTETRISNNNIRNVFRGIKCSNWQMKSCFTVNNAINLVSEPNGFRGTVTTQYGILHENSLRDVINNNTVTGFGMAKPTVYAIWVRDNNLQTLTCNSTNNTFEGFRFQGAQNLTNWANNNMRSHRRGMHLNNTVIGQQGGINRPINNVWELQGNGWSGVNFQTFITSSQANTNAINSRLFVRNNILNRPSNNSSNNILVVLPYSLQNNLISTNGFNFNFCPPTSTVLGPIRSLLDVLQPLIGRRTLVKLAYDSIAYLNFEPSLRQNAKRQVYKLLKDDADLSNNDADLQNFYNLQSSSNIGKFEQLEGELFNSNITQAKQYQQSITNQTEVETNTKIFYNLYFKAADSAFTQIDDTTLLLMANECPDKAGIVVYEARALYNYLHNANYPFEDNCEVVNASRENKQEDNSFYNDNAFINSIAVYPNPNQGSFSIHIEDISVEQLHIKIYDVNGRLVLEAMNKPLQNQSLNINSQLSTGVYMLQVYDEQSQTEYKQKLIITK